MVCASQEANRRVNLEEESPLFLPFTLQRSKPTSSLPTSPGEVPPAGRRWLQPPGGSSSSPAARLPTAPHGEQGGDWCGEGAKRWGRTGTAPPVGQRHLASQPDSLSCLLKAQQQPAPQNIGSFLIMKCVYEHFPPFLACKRTERYWNRQQK